MQLSERSVVMCVRVNKLPAFICMWESSFFFISLCEEAATQPSMWEKSSCPLSERRQGIHVYIGSFFFFLSEECSSSERNAAYIWNKKAAQLLCWRKNPLCERKGCQHSCLFRKAHFFCFCEKVLLESCCAALFVREDAHVLCVREAAAQSYEFENELVFFT